MRKVGIMLLASLFFVFGCEKIPHKETKSVEKKGGVLPIRPSNVPKGVMPAPLKLEHLDLKSFLGKFKYRNKPVNYSIGTDFETKVDPGLYHFERVDVKVADTTSEIRMQNFGAWAIWRNVDLNYEMITSMVTENGVMMHFHTLSPKLKSINSFEVARRITVDATETYKVGKFSTDESYQYTFYTTVHGEGTDSIKGGMIIPASGNYMMLGESR